ncbi:hypothetical protein ACQEVF_57710 [Nonomuraea polychroma]|uniref:hypothetical protein n=1 Tax=Nonomuraea polychroma TaxID=46176 RepID=UPI003D8C04B7
MARPVSLRHVADVIDAVAGEVEDAQRRDETHAGNHHEHGNAAYEMPIAHLAEMRRIAASAARLTLALQAVVLESDDRTHNAGTADNAAVDLIGLNGLLARAAKQAAAIRRRLIHARPRDPAAQDVATSSEGPGGET